MPFIAQIPEQPEIAALDRVYSQISAEIIALFLSVDILNYSEIKALQVRKKINSYIRRLDLVAVKHSKRFIPEAYNTARQRSETSLRVLGADRDRDPDLEKAHGAAISGHEKETIKTLVSANGSIRKVADNYLLLTKQISDSLLQLQEFGGGALTDEEQEVILNTIARSVASAKSRGSVAKQIREMIQGYLGDGQLIEINGRYYKLNKYANLVARTEMRKSQSEAVKNSCNQYKNDLVEVSDHGTTTEICEEYEGNTYSISGSDSDYPLLPADPPFHPNCKHFLIPTSREAIAFGR